jgi:hypothetical protein
MKKQSSIILVFLFMIQALYGQSKVAVLDASLGSGVHPNASAIVADTLNEQFVKSKDFIAIDRAYISSIQEEKKFQVSGEVNADDIKELGITFGAEFICIANVSQLGSTYTVSARLIKVETAQVVTQESARKQGEIDVLFDIAEEVGSKLIGKEVSDNSDTEVPVEQEKPVVSEQQTTKPVESASKKARARYTLGYLFTGYLGDDGNTTYSGDDYYSFYEMDEYLTDDDVMVTAWDNANSTSWGIDFHILFPVNLIYYGFGASYTAQTIDAEYYDTGTFSNLNAHWANFSTFDITVSLGGIYPVINNLQVYGGVNIGYLIFITGSDYSGDASGSLWGDTADETASGISYGFELGGDFFIGGLCISAKYKLSVSPDITGEYTFTDEYEESGGDTSYGVHGLVFGVGASY